MRRPAKNLTLSSLFIALAVTIPILLHSFGVGPMLLPMFWPVAVSFYFLPLSYACAVGILSPLLSTMLTGMPPVSPPIVLAVMLELLVLTWVGNIVYFKLSSGTFFPIFAGLLASRFALFYVLLKLAPIFGLPSRLFSFAAIVHSLPGTLFMLIAIPLIVSSLKREAVITIARKHV
jgi:hypothetical protein